MQHCLVYNFWFGVINVGCQGYLASSFISSHRLSQVQNQFTNIWWNLLKWNVFLPWAWTVKKQFLHHKIIMQTWQRHERKETGFMKKSLFLTQKFFFSCQLVFNILLHFSSSFTKTWKCLSFGIKKYPLLLLQVDINVFFFFSSWLWAAQSHILCIVFNGGTSFKLKASRKTQNYLLLLKVFFNVWLKPMTMKHYGSKCLKWHLP